MNREACPAFPVDVSVSHQGERSPKNTVKASSVLASPDRFIEISQFMNEYLHLMQTQHLKKQIQAF
jgi:hypothetical protein